MNILTFLQFNNHLTNFLIILLKLLQICFHVLLILGIKSKEHFHIIYQTIRVRIYNNCISIHIYVIHRIIRPILIR